MLCNRSGLCCIIKRKINFVWGRRGKVSPRPAKIEFYCQVSQHVCRPLRGYLQLYIDEFFWILIGGLLQGNGRLQEFDSNDNVTDTKETKMVLHTWCTHRTSQLAVFCHVLVFRHTATVFCHCLTTYRFVVTNKFWIEMTSKQLLRFIIFSISVCRFHFLQGAIKIFSFS